MARKKSSDEPRCLSALRRAALPDRPLRSATTQYFILGDGVGQGMAIALKAVAAVTPLPPIAIDPAYRKARRLRIIGNIKYVSQRAETYRLSSKLLKKASAFVVLACRAHTPVGKFVTRLRAAAPRGSRLYAACLPCHSPGLRGRVQLVRGWQLLLPRGTAGYAKSKYVADGTGARCVSPNATQRKRCLATIRRRIAAAMRTCVAKKKPTARRRSSA